MQSKRIDYLDSIRGIAASIVVIYHCYIDSVGGLPLEGGFFAAFNSFSSFLHYAGDKLLAGRGAVMLFFVLSGFVLTYSLEKKHTAYIPFIIKRFFRIYPAFIVVIISSYLLHKLIGVRHEESNQNLILIIHPNLSAKVLFEHLILWGTGQAQRLDGVIWSLVYEIRIAFLFPLILLSIKKYGLFSVLFWWALSLICTALSFKLYGQLLMGNQEQTFLATLLATGYFIIFFAAGAFLCVKRNELVMRIAQLSHFKKLCLFGLAAACYMKATPSFHDIHGILSDYITGFSSLLVLTLALSVTKFQKILTHKIPVWLGRISFGLYLIHVPVLYVVTQTLGVNWPVWLSILMVITISLILAELIFVFIETPGIKLGKRLAGNT